MKTILFVAPGVEPGGMAVAFTAMAQSLETLGYQIKVIVEDKEKLVDCAIPQRYVVGWCWPKPCRFGPLKRLLFWLNAFTGWRFYFALTPKVEHDILVVSRIQSFWWTYYSQRPTIGWIHELAPDRPWVSKGRDKLLCGGVRRYDKLVAVSESAAISWKKRYGLNQLPLVIPNLIDIDGIERKSEDSVSDIDHGPGPIAICVSRLSPEKGIDRLLDSARNLRDQGFKFNLWILGDGSERDEYVRFIKGNGLDHNVQLLGYKENPYPYMKMADFLICPSRAEGYGLVLVEALLIGTSVVSSDCGGTRYALANGSWGTLVRNDDKSLESAFKKCIQDGRAKLPDCGFSGVRESIINQNKQSVVSLQTVFNNKL